MNTQFQNKIYDTIVIGAGISGISAACHLKKYSPKANFLILEGRDNFGGTWDFFKYPGIRSDSTHLEMQVPSLISQLEIHSK